MIIEGCKYQGAGLQVVTWMNATEFSFLKENSGLFFNI